MQLLATQYTLSTQALEIYFAGCKGPHCEGCHNPESWDMKAGDAISPAELSLVIANKVYGSGDMIKQISILGGEPLDQDPTELMILIESLSTLKVPIWLFTRYEIYDIPFSLRIKFDYIKTGRYIADQPTEPGQFLASSNQRLLRRGYDY